MGDLIGPCDLAADGVDGVEMERSLEVPEGHQRGKKAGEETALWLDRAVPSPAKNNHHRLHCNGCSFVK